MILIDLRKRKKNQKPLYSQDIELELEIEKCVMPIMKKGKEK